MKRPPISALLRQSSPLVLGRVASAALTFALPLALARALDPAAFGSYKQLFLVAQTVLMVGQFGLTQSLYFFVPREGARRGTYVSHVAALVALVALGAGVALAFGAPALGRHLGDGGIAGLGLPLGLLAAGLLASSPLEAALTSEGRVGAAALSYVLSDGTRALLLIVGARHAGLLGVAFAGALYAGLRLLAFLTLLATRVIPLGRPSGKALLVQLAFALPFAGSVWLWVAQKQFAQYVVAARFSPARFALFAVASFHLAMVDIVHTPVGEVLMVRLGRLPAGDLAGRRREWNDAVAKLATLLLPAAACAFLLGPRLLPILFTHRYDASVPLFLIATLEVPLWALPVDGLLRAAGATRFLFGWYGARLGLTATVVLGGVRYFGLGGAIAGGVFCEAISRLVMLRRGCRWLGVPLARGVDGALLFRTAAAATLAALPAWLTERYTFGLPGLVATALVYGAGYVALRIALPSQGAAPAAETVAAPT